MASNDILMKREGGIVTAVLNRPDRLNVLNKEVFEDLKELVDVLETDKSVRVLIFTGAGDKAFCAGADLKERYGMNEKSTLQRFELVRSLYLRLERLSFPVIAAINGMALGGGLELALACDLRVASENSVLGMPEVELGMIPGTGGTQRLTRAIGMPRALELILLARRISAKEAFDCGLIHAIAPFNQSLAFAKGWAQKLLEHAPLALKQAKTAVRQGAEKPLEQALTFEIEAYRPLLASRDRLEGLKAFLEKRKPVYRGE